MATSSTISGGSTIDAQQLAKQLVEVERAPQDAQIKRAGQRTATSLSALSTLKSALSTFQTAVSSLSTMTDFGTRAATSSDTGKFTATATSKAVPGTYSVEVVDLAAAHQIASGPHAGGSTAVVGTGTLSVSVGGASFDVTIDATNNTLAGIRDAINKAADNTGVSATIVQSSAGARLILSGRDTGAANTIAVSQAGGDGGLAGLAYSDAVPGDWTELAEAADALVNVAGFAQTSPTNTIIDAIDGVAINLLGAEPGTELELTISQDTTLARTRIQTFVSSYNAMQTTISGLRSYDATSRAAGPLLGDALLQNVESQIRRGLTDTVAGVPGGLSSLASIGITTTATGTLSIDAAKLDAALAANFNGVASLFGSETGIAARLEDKLDAALASNGGIQTRTAALNREQLALADREASLDSRMASLLQRYVQQFTQLDALLSTLNTTSSYLTQQLDSLAALRNSER